MNGTPTDFWGKLERDRNTNTVAKWHPLIDHCADVAACASALLGLPTWRRRLARLCGREELDDVTHARLAVLAALHDLGKFNLGFQAKGRPELGTTAGHVKEALAAIDASALPSVEPLGSWGEGATGLLLSAICHHGRPYSGESAGRCERVLWVTRKDLDPITGVGTLVDACRVWFPLAFDASAPDLPNEAGFEHAFAGLVMLADWIGSDARFFSYSNPGDGDHMSFARDQAMRFVSEGWLDIDDSRRADRRERGAFARVAPDRQPRPAQAAMLALPSDDDWSVTILESETGSGKTEAALARFVALFSAGSVDGLYFALPTRTAATQMYQRVLLAAQHAFATPPPVVLAVPGYLRVDGSRGERLPEFQVLWADRDEDRFRYRAWAGEGAKRYLAGCIVVGTIDQVLLSSLRVGHAHLRATALLRQLLVVDEVHASDAYMTRVLEDVLARHRRAGGHALLLSATLGSETRARLLHAGEQASSSALDGAVKTWYPLISHRGTRDFTVEVARDRELRGAGKPRVVVVTSVPLLEDATSVAATALAAAREGAKVLVIKNTVADCVATQRAIERLAAAVGATGVLFNCAGVLAPHHARFARVDREALDKALEQQIGETRPSGGCVVVATQTVQQSLDLDADLLLSDLCPLDVLLQRIGRLHRHLRARPAGFDVPRAMVIVPASRDLGALLNEHGRARHHYGLGTVYPDLRVLEATWRVIEETQSWRIPEMNRALVERSVHSTALNAITASGGEIWEAHAQLMLGTKRGEMRQADLNLVDWTKPYSETNFAEDERIPTRLGEGDRRVHFERSFPSPFRCLVNELIIRASWTAGISSDVETAHAVESRDGVTRFAFGDKKFIYDRHGLRKGTEEPEDIADDDGP